MVSCDGVAEQEEAEDDVLRIQKKIGVRPKHFAMGGSMSLAHWPVVGDKASLPRAEEVLRYLPSRLEALRQVNLGTSGTYVLCSNDPSLQQKLSFFFSLDWLHAPK